MIWRVNSRTSKRLWAHSKDLKKHHLLRHLLVLVVSIGAAILLSRLGVFESLISQSKGLRLLEMFVAGFFYTSVLTVGPAAVAILEIAEHNSMWAIAAIGALGSVIADSLLFILVKKEIAPELPANKVFKNPAMKFLSPIIGFLIIASPLPDELGLAFLGISGTRNWKFLAVSYLANFTGIFILIGVVTSLV